MDRSRGRRADRHRRCGCGTLRVRRIAGARADRPAAALPAPDLHGQRDRDVPGRDGLLRRGRLPAALVPVRERQLGDRGWLPDPPACRRSDHLRRRVRTVRGADRSVQDTDHRFDVLARGRPLADDEPPSRYAASAPVAMDVHRRPRHRPVLRRLHTGGAELRASARPRDRHEQPDAVPAARRDDRPCDHGHDLRGASCWRRSRSSSSRPGCRRSSRTRSRKAARPSSTS